MPRFLCPAAGTVRYQQSFSVSSLARLGPMQFSDIVVQNLLKFSQPFQNTIYNKPLAGTPPRALILRPAPSPTFSNTFNLSWDLLKAPWNPGCIPRGVFERMLWELCWGGGSLLSPCAGSPPRKQLSSRAGEINRCLLQSELAMKNW